MLFRNTKLIAVVAAGTMVFLSSRSPAQSSAASNAGRGTAQVETEKLAAVLRSAAPHEQKLLACKRLALVGGRESVPVLAPLLANERLSHAARIALEAIPDPSAAEALRNAMPGLKGKLLVGVINSLGARRDPKATAPLATHLVDEDAGVACAAARALGKIAAPESARALRQAIVTVKGPVRVSVGDGLMACAEAWMRESKHDEAAAIYDGVIKADLPKRLRLAAARGAILAGGPAGVDLLVNQLKASDDESFAAALGVSRELAGP
jgi:HEAT repeat protein